MTKPPRTTRHLLAFAISLVILVAALALFLFGVKMEDSAPGKGVITSTRIVELRAPAAGRIVVDADDDDAGNSTLSLPGPGEVIPDGRIFGVLVNGPGTGKVRIFAGKSGKASENGVGRKWRVVEVPVRAGQRVAEGDLIAQLVELDPGNSDQIRDPQVRLDIEEKYFGEIEPGKEVRLYSNMYHHRIHGVARGRVERLEPAGEPGPNGSRVFRAWVAITDSPFPLKLGSSVRAEIIIGRKPTYQIILEH